MITFTPVQDGEEGDSEPLAPDHRRIMLGQRLIDVQITEGGTVLLQFEDPDNETDGFDLKITE